MNVWLQGYFNSTVEDIKDVFGQPFITDGSEKYGHLEWSKKTTDKDWMTHVFTIYTRAKIKANDEVYRWHIGGASQYVLWHVQKMFEKEGKLVSVSRC